MKLYFRDKGKTKLLLDMRRERNITIKGGSSDQNKRTRHRNSELHNRMKRARHG